MKFKSIRIQNVLSIEDITVNFDNNGTLLVSGFNHDADRANGSGKSSIFTALVWGVYNDYPRNISVTDLVRRGSKKAIVTIELVTGGKDLTIVRYRPGGLIVTDSEGNNITEAEYNQLLDISYEQFMLVVYFAQGLNERFLSLNDTSRKEFILKLLKTDKFQSLTDKIEPKRKQLLKDIESNESYIKTIDATIEAWEYSLIELNDLQAKKIDTQNQIDDVRDNLSTLTLDKPDVEKFTSTLSKINKELNEISIKKGEIRSAQRKIQEVSNQKQPVDTFDYTCPECNNNLDVIGNDLQVHNHSSFIQKQAKFTQNKEATIIKLTEELSILQEAIIKEEKYLDVKLSLEQKIQELNADYTEQSRKKGLFNLHISNLTTLLKNIQDSIDEKLKIKDKIGAQKAKKREVEKTVYNQKETLTKLKTVLDILSPTGIQSYILDSVVDLFNQKVQDYIDILWDQASYQLLTHKESKTGIITAKTSDSLTISGEQVSVGSLSGGEYKALSMAVDVALLEVLYTSLGVDVNLVILDEPFNGLDASSKMRAMDMLQKIGEERLVIVVDHSSETQSTFDKSIRVEKRDGVSKLVV